MKAAVHVEYLADWGGGARWAGSSWRSGLLKADKRLEKTEWDKRARRHREDERVDSAIKNGISQGDLSPR
jgi:hypothetical protein